MEPRQSARTIALLSILDAAKEKPHSGLTDTEWEKIVNLAWESQSVIDEMGRQPVRKALTEILEEVVRRNGNEDK